MTAMISTVTRATTIPVFSLMSFTNTSFRIFWEALEDAARSWESAVDMVAARIPARIRPATMAARNPCLEIRSATTRIMVSGSSSTGITPAFDMAFPTTPINTAITMEMTTQMVATLLESFSFFASSIAIKRSSTWGIPK